MADYSVTFARSARKELQDLAPSIAERIIDHIEALKENPRPAGSIKLQGGKQLWRIRIGDYRVVYAIDDSSRTVDVSVIRHRKDAYRGL